MDEMSLKSHLFYNASADSISGFENLGERKTSSLVANSALFLMAHGILDNWKQPVARWYYEMHGEQYFTFFDPPHLLKSVRNNLLKYSFSFDNKTALWSDIKEFFDKE